MRALSITVAALTLAAAFAPAQALACGMVMREPVNLAELMEEVDEVEEDVAVTEVAEDKAADETKTEPEVETDKAPVQPNS